MSVAYLSEVERGRKEPSSEVLIAICRALGLRLVDLVGAAHAELARAEGRVVVDLTAPGAAPASTGLVATSTEHELASVTRCPDGRRRACRSPQVTIATRVDAVLLAA